MTPNAATKASSSPDSPRRTSRRTGSTTMACHSPHSVRPVNRASRASSERTRMVRPSTVMRHGSPSPSAPPSHASPPSPRSRRSDRARRFVRHPSTSGVTVRMYGSLRYGPPLRAVQRAGRRASRSVARARRCGKTHRRAAPKTGAWRQPAPPMNRPWKQAFPGPRSGTSTEPFCFDHELSYSDRQFTTGVSSHHPTFLPAPPQPAVSAARIRPDR